MGDVDDEAQLPKATVAKFCKGVLPNGMRCSVETRELLCKAASEFIQMLSAESLEKATVAKKSKITREHLEQACESIGFSHYIEEMRAVSDEVGEAKVERGKKRKPTKSPEELLASQQALFAKAAANSHLL